jgi:hypothetical protein
MLDDQSHTRSHSLDSSLEASLHRAILCRRLSILTTSLEASKLALCACELRNTIEPELTFV